MTDAKQEGLFTFDPAYPAVMSFPNLFTPRKFKDPKTQKETGEAKYDAMLVFEADNPNLAAIKTKLAEIAKGKFPGRDFSTLQFPLKNGTALADDAKAKGKDSEFMRGKVVLTARSQYAPILSAIVNGKIVEFTGEARPIAEPKFYPGVNVLAELNFQPHEVGTNKPGVTAYLNKVFSTERGDRLAAGKSSAETFQGYVGHMSATDPTAGAPAGEVIPF
jgi:hypothetical protein